MLNASDRLSEKNTVIDGIVDLWYNVTVLTNKFPFQPVTSELWSRILWRVKVSDKNEY